MLTPVLLSGGVGSRLWPVSREGRPKQFLPLGGELSMLQETQRRLAGLDTSAPIVVCNEAHRFMVAEQMREIMVNAQAILLEPEGRNTAPAIALAAIEALKTDADAVLLVLPADHYIGDAGGFRAAVEAALPTAMAGHLVTFGVVPNRPETGYGYIRCGNALADGISELAEFVEKPDRATAEQYLTAGQYLWNSGMFLFRADHYLQALRSANSPMADACAAAMDNAVSDLDFVRPEREAFLACPSDSIDYAVMEHTDRGAVVALDCGWSDIGAWSALWEVGAADPSGNVTEGDVLLHDTKSSYIRSETRLVATAGVSNLVIVETLTR